MAKAMSPDEILERARFLITCHGHISTNDLVRFCQGSIDPHEARLVLHNNFTEVAPDEYRDFGHRQQVPPSPPLSFANLQSQLNQYTQSPPNMLSQMYGLQAFIDDEKKEKSPKSPFKKGDRVELTADYAAGTLAGSLGTIEKNLNGSSDVFIDGVEGTAILISWEMLRLYTKPKVTIDSVVLLPSKKEEIRAAISQQEHANMIFDKWGFGTVFEKGTAISLLFWGVPGTGKTLMAQAIADEFDADLKIYATADIQSSEPGGAERMIRTIFREASKHNKGKGRKRVILFDECDSLLMDRNEVGPILGAEVNALLTEIEHYEGIVIFTTNRLGKLDPALERRLSAKIEFEFPDKKARLAIWQRMIPKQAPLHKDVSFEKLAEFAIAGGNIKNAVLSAARHAAYKGHKQINHQHFQDAVKREVASQKAFQDEYEKQTHTSMHGYARNKGGIEVNRGVEMNKTVSINKTLQMGAKDEE